MKKTLIMMISMVFLLNACGKKEAAMDHSKHEGKKIAGCEITHFIAELDKKSDPNTLTVMGNIVTMTENATIEFKPADPQGIDATTLLMSLKITEADEGMTHPKKHIHYEKTDGDLSSYKKVQVQGYDKCVADVKPKG